MPPTSSHSPRPTSRASGRLAPALADPAPLFVYGSLRFPDVLETLIDRDPARTPATVTGWRVVALPDEVYPTLIPDPHAEAMGHLLHDLTIAERATLDAFEHPDYHLTRVTATGGQPAWAYTAPDVPGIDPDHWDPDTFAATHLTDYLTRCATWRHHHDRSHAPGS